LEEDLKNEQSMMENLNETWKMAKTLNPDWTILPSKKNSDPT
jgi:hypothetical protein